MNELAKPQSCILMHSGMEIWINDDQLGSVEQAMNIVDSRFIKVQGKTLNINSIEGIYPALDMEDRSRRKNGQFKCRYNRWHEKGQQCGCGELVRLGMIKKKEDGTY